MKIAIIIGSTRPNRVGEGVGQWVFEQARKRTDAEFELIDLKEVNLPMFDEPRPPAAGQYEHAHTKAWAAKIAPFDGFIFVTSEYNHGPPPALKNALDFLYKEWNNKACGFVSYGMAGGVRAVEQLRACISNLDMADVRVQVTLSLRTDFENMKVFKPAAYQEVGLKGLIDQLISWSGALKPLRKT